MSPAGALATAQALTKAGALISQSAEQLGAQRTALLPHVNIPEVVKAISAIDKRLARLNPAGVDITGKPVRDEIADRAAAREARRAAKHGV